MNTKILKSAVLIASLIVASNVSALGLGVTASTSAVKLSARIETARDRANKEIDRRIEALNTLSARIGSLVRVSANEKTRLATSISAQITTLTNLKVKIASDTDITTLKADIKSITQSYRIFMLVIPQGRIAATVDVVNATSDLITSVGMKLQTRISAAQNAGKDVNEMNALLLDLNAKAADAKVSAAAALALTVNLTPDNGDQTIMKANNQAFADARAKLKLAHDDFVTARTDAKKIVDILKSMKLSGTASSTSTVQ